MFNMNAVPAKLYHENELWAKDVTRVAGVDEAGRGPLAGPVVAAAIIFQPGDLIKGVDDSKKLSHHQRAKFFPQLISLCTSYGVGIVNADEIDRINIFQASMLAMRKALAQLNPTPEHVLVDGRPLKEISYPQTALIKGDSRSFTIGAASILAKVIRDEIMIHFHREYPIYGFNQHKGYATRVHLNALKRFGPCEIHRRSFRPRALQSSSAEQIQ